jgi:hypothetical protein
VKHYVLTRSAYGPAWDIAANARRLAVTKAVTARLLSLQTCSDWTWIVLLDERDPLLRDRMAMYADHSPTFLPIVWTPDERVVASRPRSSLERRQRMAAADYRAPWRDSVPADDTVLMTRLDDDDGLAPDAVERFQRTAGSVRAVLMFPVGIRVWRGRYVDVRHERNAMHTLLTPPGDTLCVYDYSHAKVAQNVPVTMVDEEPGWLWVRHRDTISGWRRADHVITPAVRELFPIDWPALAANWSGR